MSYHGHARSLKTVTDICLLDEVDMAAVISDLVAINKRYSEVVVVQRRCTMFFVRSVPVCVSPFTRFLHRDCILLLFMHYSARRLNSYSSQKVMSA